MEAQISLPADLKAKAEQAASTRGMSLPDFVRQSLEQAIDADRDGEAIQEGIAQADAGDTLPLAEADQKIRSEFGFPPRA